MNQDQIQTYFDVEVADGYGLMCLRKYTDVEKGKRMCKHPIVGRSWGGVVFDRGQIEQGIKEGRNLGYRIREDELVIDMDPRDYGGKSVAEVEDWIAGLLDCMDFDDVKKEYPVVKTGSDDGYHIYLKMAEGWNGKESGWSEGCDEWKGVEFKKAGKYLVCAGSRHPNGKWYEWVGDVRLSDRQLVNGAVATGLGETLERSVGNPGVYEAGGDESWRAGVLSPIQLKAWVLDQLDVEQFKSEGDWIHVVRGCHHATNGEAEEEFVAWCLGDTDYLQDESIIRDVWRRQKLGGGKVTNAWSLLGVLRKAGVLVQGSELSRCLEDAERAHSLTGDFAGLEDAGDGDVIDQYLEEMQEKEDFESVVPPKGCDQLAWNAVKGMSKGSTGEDIALAIKAVLHVKDGLMRGDLLEQIRTKRDIEKRLFTGLVTEAKEDNKAALDKDLPRLLAELTLQMKFYEGKGLIYSVSEQLWGYNGMYWSVVTKRWVEGRITEVLDGLRKKIKIKKAENTLVNEASSVILRLCAVNEDMLGLKQRPKSVVNCLNGEYWLEEGILKPHRPESYLLQVINVKYDQWAECPKMLRLLEGTFARCSKVDRKAKIRFLWQIHGYSVDPDKTLDRWFMFYGSGGDGKSVLINILMSLLGGAVLPASIGDFEKKNHIMAEVPGKLLIVDEDMDAKVRLPDGMLKKLSGHTQLAGDPKFAKMEYFVPACTVLLCGNHLPITDDVTVAARRRPIVMTFDQDFHEEGSGGVKGIDQMIIREELPGVLNMAIEGRGQIQENVSAGRGGFDIPRSCQVATENWINESNMVALFVAERVDRTGDREDKLLLIDAFEAYLGWCRANGINKPSGKQFFRKGVEGLGVTYDDQMLGGKRGFRGVKLKGGEGFLD